VLKKGGLGAQLKKLPRGPDLAELHQLLSQCFEQRGRPVKIAWRGPSLTPFTLEVVCNLKNGNAQWRLYGEQNQPPLFDYTSVDVLLIYNLVASHCADVQQSKSASEHSLSASVSHNRLPAAETAADAAAVAQSASDLSQSEIAGQASYGQPVAAMQSSPHQQAIAQSYTAGDHDVPAQPLAGDSAQVQNLKQADLPTAQPNLPAGQQNNRYASVPPHLFAQTHVSSLDSPSAQGAVQAGNQPAHTQFVPTPGEVPRSQNAAIDGPLMVQSSEAYKDLQDLLPREGRVKEGLLAELLQDIARANGTGRLDVRDNDLSATVYIQDGKPIDATASDTTGDDAVIELLTWRQGTFTFEPRVLRNNQTIRENIASLVARSKKLSEHFEHLKSAGMLPGSSFAPRNELLSEHDFISKISENCPSDIETVSRVYRSLDGKRSFEELYRTLKISRIQLIHIIFHLLIKELIKIINDDNPHNLLTLTPRAIDHAAIDSIMVSLRRPDTGLFIYPAFLYFLEQEYFRSYRSRTAFSVVVFELRQKKVIDGKVVRRVLDERALMDAVLRISHLKRHVDLISHYDSYDYALLLPSTKVQGAEIFINRIIDALRSKPLGEVDPSQLTMAFGSSSVPEDFKDMSSLLGAASLAMEQARETGKTVVMYRDIKNMVRS